MHTLPKRVLISDNVLISCVGHALTTEGEEIIGFCLGGQVGDDGLVWETCVRPRSDKQSDRVEVSPEDQIEAAQEAERVTDATGVPTRVAGWYHSHPKITCPPSHVDLRTQSTLQQYGISIGLIFSVFNEPTEYKQKTSRIQLHCFQSGAGDQPISLPVFVESQQEILQRASVGSSPQNDAKLVPLYKKVARVVEVMVEEENIAFDDQTSKFKLTPTGTVHASSVYSKTISNLKAGYLRPLGNALDDSYDHLQAGTIETQVGELHELIELKNTECAELQEEVDSITEQRNKVLKELENLEFPN